MKIIGNSALLGVQVGGPVGAMMGCLLLALGWKFPFGAAALFGIPLGAVGGCAGGAALGAIFGSGLQWKEWMENRTDAKTLEHVVPVKPNAIGHWFSL